MAAAARHRVMRTLGFVLALVLGFMCWAIVLALSGGVAPLGKVGAYEALMFFAPIVIFALSMSVALAKPNPPGSRQSSCPVARYS